jgi:hypothetical protein
MYEALDLIPLQPYPKKNYVISTGSIMEIKKQI